MTLTVQLSVTPRSLDAMKGYLTRAIPEVKSSHRCEALARALGYRTYATALSNAATLSGGARVVEHEPFRDYLAAHGFDADPNHLFRSAASGALALVHDIEPRLTSIGIGVGEPKVSSGGTMETKSERMQRHAGLRSELLSDWSTLPFLLSLALVQRIPRTRTIRPGSGSYRLKHVTENSVTTFPGGGILGPLYVPNGVLIAAAIHAGFEYETGRAASGYPDLNVTFAMQKKVIDDLDVEFRPNGALAQDRGRREELRRQFGPLMRYLSVTS